MKQHSVKSGGRQNKSEMIEALLSFAKESAASDEAVSGDRNTASICGSTVASSSTTRINKRTADEEASTKPAKILKTTVCQSSQAASEFTANALSIQEKDSEPGSSSSHRTFASTEFSASPSRQVCPVVSSTASSVAIIDPTASSSSRLTVSVNAHQPVMPELNRQISIHPFSGYEEETSSVSEDVREDTADEDEQGQAEYDDFMGDKEMILDSRPGSPTFYV